MRVLSSIILLFFLAGTGIAAQNFPRVEPDPKAVEYAARGTSEYSWADLAEISLWASGAADIAAGMATLHAAVDELQSSPDLPAGQRERAEYVLGFTHRKWLKSYSFNQTRIDTLLSGGRYNCVSSAVLYMILARAAGLDVRGVMTKDHAFAIVNLPADGPVDVETTNPYGFDPGSRKDFQDQFGRVTGFAYVPVTNYRDRTAISPIELVSLIFQNRIADFEARGRFAEAVPPAVDRAVLLGTGVGTATAAEGLFDDPRQDMMNRIFNYGASLLRAGKEEDCLAWAGLVMPLYGDDRWQEFVQVAVNNRSQKLVTAGQFTAARELLDTNRQFLEQGEYVRLESAVIDTEIVSGASRIKTADEGGMMLEAIEQARIAGKMEDARAGELITFTVQKTAAALSAAPARDWPAAIGFIEKAIARFGSSPDLDRSLQTYRANRAADFHNRFASAYNRQNFEEAARIVGEGLAEFPDNRQLLADKLLLEL